MTTPNHHPSQRFIAPSTIQHGVPLKDLMDRKLIALIANHLGDIAKDHLEVALDVCEAWLEELKRSDDETVVSPGELNAASSGRN